MSNTEDKIAYRWVDVKGDNYDIIRLEDIRFMALMNQGGRRTLVSAVPILMRDGKAPEIRLYASNVFQMTDAARKHKLVHQKLTADQLETVIPVNMLFRGDPTGNPIWEPIAESLEEQLTKPAHPLLEPMWVRWARDRKKLTPRDSLLLRDELGLDEHGEYSQECLKQRWDQLASNAAIIGYTPRGFIWEFGLIRAGGSVGCPRPEYEEQAGAIASGTVITSDFAHIQRTRKWKLFRI